MIDRALRSVAAALASVGLVIVGLAVTAAAEPRATVVAAATRVLEVPDGSGSFGSSGTAVVLVAVDADAALAVSTVMAEGPVSVHIRSRSTTG